MVLTLAVIRREWLTLGTIFNPQHTEELMIILAIDLGKFNSMCCFFDTATQGHRFQAAHASRRIGETADGRG